MCDQGPRGFHASYVSCSFPLDVASVQDVAVSAGQWAKKTSLLLLLLDKFSGKSFDLLPS
jgi:hypothetical protein